MGKIVLKVSWKSNGDLIFPCVCVCSCKDRQLGTSVGFTPGNWAYISHRAYACLFNLARTMQNELSIDPRGTLVVYNAPAHFT